MRKLISFTLLILFSTLQLWGLKLYVRGYVVTEGGAGIDYATVAVKGTSIGVQTNAKGYYELLIEGKDLQDIARTTSTATTGANSTTSAPTTSISSASLDSITISYSCVGYYSQEFTLAIQQTHQSAQVNRTLKENLAMLAQVEIKAFKHVTSNVKIIDPSQLRIMPDASGGNIESLLTQVAGVSSTDELSSQYSVRGGSYDENAVYVNGIEVHRSILVRQSQQEGLSFVNPNLVESVNFSAGGFDAQYGDKMSSVLDVNYKSPEKTEGSVSLGLLGASAYFGSKYKNFTQVHGLRYKTSKYLLGSLDTEGDYDPSFLDYQTYMTLKLSDKFMLSFLGNIANNTFRFEPKDRSTTFGGTTSYGKEFSVSFEGEEKDEFQTYFGLLNGEYKINDRLEMNFGLTAYLSQEKVTYDIRGDYWLSVLDLTGSSSDEETSIQGVGGYLEHARNDLDVVIYALDYKGEYKLDHVETQWGFTAQMEKMNDNIHEWSVQDSAGYIVPVNDGPISMGYLLDSKHDVSTSRMVAFLQQHYHWETAYGKLHWNVGLRTNYWAFNDEWLWSPRTSLYFSPNWEKDINFRFSTGVYYQAPFYKEMSHQIEVSEGVYAVDLNKDIKAQRSLHFILGMDYYFRSWNRPFKFTLETYYKPADRIISYYVDNVRVRYSGENDAKSYTLGLDAKLFGEIVPGTDSWISFSLMQSKENLYSDEVAIYSNTGTSLGTAYPAWISRPNEQRYNVSFFVQDYFPQHPEFKVHFKFVYADGLPFGPPDSERYLAILRTSSYRRLDFGVTREYKKDKDRFMRYLKYVKAININAEILNVFDIANVNSYYWVTDVDKQQYAVPNYLTGRRLNLQLTIDF